MRPVMIQSLSMCLSVESGMHSFGRGIPAYASQDNGAEDYDASVNGTFLKTDEKYDGDREIYKMFAMEAFNRFGFELDYHIVSYDKKYDGLFGEDCDQRLERVFPLMAYSPNLPSCNKMWDMFGIENAEGVVELFVSKEHFEAVSSAEMFSFEDNSSHGLYPTSFTENYVPSSTETGTKSMEGRFDNTRMSDMFEIGSPMRSYIPKVGDIVRMKEWNGKLYTITKVGEEEEEFLQEKHYWVLELTQFDNDHLKTRTDNAPLMKINDVIESDDIFDVGDLMDALTDGSDEIGDTEFPVTGKGKLKEKYGPSDTESRPNDTFGGF